MPLGPSEPTPGRGGTRIALHDRGRSARPGRSRLAGVAGALALTAALLSGCGDQPSIQPTDPPADREIEPLPPASGVASGVVLGPEHPLSAPDVDQATVWAVGDGADGTTQSKEVVEMIAVEGLDRLLYTGDVYPDGSAVNYALAYDTVYGRFARRTAPTPGNHEWELSEDGYFPYWKDVFGEELGFFYRFEVAGWEILSLNSAIDYDAGSMQAQWLEQQVRGGGTCRLAFWHVPRYGAGEWHEDEETLDVLWDMLRGRAAIVINGHEHNLQRLDPIEGITTMISGAGGHSLYPVDEEDPQLAFGADEVYGALRLDLRPGVARYAFVDVEGTTLDRGRVRCRS